MSQEERKRGRKPVMNPKEKRFSIRIDENTESRLEAYCREHQITKGEAIRRGIDRLLSGE